MGRSKKNKKSMASGEGDTGGKMEIPAEDSSRPEEHLSDSVINRRSKDGSVVNLVLENGLSDGNEGPADTGGTMEIHAQDSSKPEEHLSDGNKGLADTGGMMEIHAQDSSKPGEHLSDSDMNQQSKDGSDVNLVLENGLSDGNEGPADTSGTMEIHAQDSSKPEEHLSDGIEGLATGGTMEICTQDVSKPEEHLSDSDMNQQSKDGSNTNLVLENGFSVENEGSADTHDELMQMVVDLKFQNEFLKSQIEGFSNVESVSRESSIQKEVGGTEDGESDIVKELRERIELLNKEFLIEKQTRIASEEALKHLQIAYSDAEAKAKDLSEQLVEAQNKLEHEIKERDEKYSELDAKLNRLHKRAKQRIQEVQKEKDDLEARFSELNESAEQASSQKSALQQELERTRKQANEALKAMDGDRQQLRSANNK